MYRLILQLLFILLLLVVAFRCSAHFLTQNIRVKEEEFVVEKLQQIYFESGLLSIALEYIIWKREKKRVIPLFNCNEWKSI